MRVSFQFTREGDEIGLKGKIGGVVVNTCVRCLDPASSEVDWGFDMKVVRGGARRTLDSAGEVELGTSDLAVEYFDGRTLDLLALAVEELIVSLPDYPLCREDCKGLCPECGAELNLGPCSCADKKPVDPRLKALSSLKKR